MTSEEMASPQRRLENTRIRRNSLSQTLGVNDRQRVNIPDEDVPGELGTSDMSHGGQKGVEYQRPV